MDEDEQAEREMVAHQDSANKQIVERVVEELADATSAHMQFVSAHEGYAVILEELDELWEQVKHKRSERDLEAMAREAIQVAAMAMTFVRDVCWMHEIPTRDGS